MLPTPENDNMFGCKHHEGEFVGNIQTHALTPIIFQNYREDEFLWDIIFNMPPNTTPNRSRGVSQVLIWETPKQDMVYRIETSDAEEMLVEKNRWKWGSSNTADRAVFAVR